MSGGFNSDILPWNPCTATACKFPAKNTRNFFEVLLMPVSYTHLDVYKRQGYVCPRHLCARRDEAHHGRE